MSPSKKYRSRLSADDVVGFSISYDRDNMLQRGLGLEHLRELLVRLARPILRQGVNLAYGGNWKEAEDNFTFELLRLIRAEQEDNSLGDPDSSRHIGLLYNHSCWPHYLEITPQIEAQWINTCRIVRITQQMAEFSDSEIVPDAEFLRDPSAKEKDPRTMVNAAVTLSAMRRLMMQPIPIPVPDVPQPEVTPPVTARILLGGQVARHSGFLPGIFEEALVTLQQQRSVYILGGFGGAAEILANAILTTGVDRPAELTLAWHREHNAKLAKLLESSKQFRLPAKFVPPHNMLDSLFTFVQQAQINPAATLRTGLSDDDTRELLMTRNVANAVHLVRTGLMNQNKLTPLPA
jgi:hypothetical protein